MLEPGPTRCRIEERAPAPSDATGSRPGDPPADNFALTEFASIHPAQLDSRSSPAASTNVSRTTSASGATKRYPFSSTNTAATANPIRVFPSTKGWCFTRPNAELAESSNGRLLHGQ